MDAVELNKVFHDHECAYYDERFAIVHDEESAAEARREIEDLLGRPLIPGERVLDVGCGTGWFAAGLQKAAPEVFVAGLDLSSGMLSRARAAGAANLIQGDGTRLPFAAGALDVVCGRGVLHHLPDPSAALREWRRVLRPTGVLVLSSEPTPTVEQHGAVLVNLMLKLPGLRGGLSDEDEFWELAAMAANLHTFQRQELEDLLHAAGFGSSQIEVSGFAETMTMTASYASHGHAPALSARVPWRGLTRLANQSDRLLWDRILPDSLLHTLKGRATP